MIYLIFFLFALLSWIVSSSLEHKIKEYSKIPVALTGKQVAEKMLRENGITDVQVVSTGGHLTDHYNPATKTVNLSEAVYSGANIAAAAVAAHECGHALQHAQAYAPLKLRSALVPTVNFASRWMSWIPTFETHQAARSALKSAAYTYVVAAMASLATLFYYVLILVSRRD